MSNHVPGREPAISTGPALSRDQAGEFFEPVNDVVAAMNLAEPGSQPWRWKLRRSLAGVRDVLEAESWEAGGWLAARAAAGQRDRVALLRRVVDLGPRVLQDPAVDDVIADVKAVLADVVRHGQRAHDLAYEEVEGELGGSE